MPFAKGTNSNCVPKQAPPEMASCSKKHTKLASHHATKAQNKREHEAQHQLYRRTIIGRRQTFRSMFPTGRVPAAIPVFANF